MTEAEPDAVARGAAPGLFTHTHWSLILRARDKSEAALDALCKKYRQPLMVWLRIRNYTTHDAEDLVQGFFAHLLKRDFLNNVSPEKGRFRTFMLTALQHYLRDEHAKKAAAKRGGGQAPESLEETDAEGQPLHEPAARDSAPDVEYDRAWARAVLDNALARLQGECVRPGRAALCAALQPVLFTDETAASYRQIAEKLEMSEGAVKVAAGRIRLRLGVLLREEVLDTVVSEQELEAEVRYLISLFGR